MPLRIFVTVHQNWAGTTPMLDRAGFGVILAHYFMFQTGPWCGCYDNIADVWFLCNQGWHLDMDNLPRDTNDWQVTITGRAQIACLREIWYLIFWHFGAESLMFGALTVTAGFACAIRRSLPKSPSNIRGVTKPIIPFCYFPSFTVS